VRRKRVPRRGETPFNIEAAHRRHPLAARRRGRHHRSHGLESIARYAGQPILVEKTAARRRHRAIHRVARAAPRRIHGSGRHLGHPRLSTRRFYSSLSDLAQDFEKPLALALRGAALVLRGKKQKPAPKDVKESCLSERKQRQGHRVILRRRRSSAVVRDDIPWQVTGKSTTLPYRGEHGIADIVGRKSTELCGEPRGDSLAR